LYPETDIAVLGGWVKPPIGLDLMEILNGSMKCRGENSQVCLYQPPGDPQPTAELNQNAIIQQLLQVVVGFQGSNYDDARSL